MSLDRLIAGTIVNRSKNNIKMDFSGLAVKDCAVS